MLPPLHPETKEPVTPEFLSVLSPMALLGQDVSPDAEIEIPEPVRDIYKLWRPTPLMRALRLEQALETPAHIYYKYEGVSPVGSHKPNTAVAQAFFLKDEGGKAFTTETGAGQWGSALALACNFFGLGCEVYMVRISYEQKPARRNMTESYGASVYASPSDRTQCGQKLLAENPNHPGSLGIAVSEGIEAAVTSGGEKKYSLGSFLPHVLLHQTVIGQEALKQMDMAGEYPDIVIGCAGRRLELLRHCFSVRARERPQRQGHAHHRRRAGGMSEHDPRRVHVGLGRWRRLGADLQDVHPRPHVHPARHSRRRAALSRHVAPGLRARRQRPRRGPGRRPGVHGRGGA